MPDLANAMKINPNLKIQLNAGYFDLATPFYQGVYEMHHLPIPANLQSNIEYKFYDSGHMVYAKDASLKMLHDNVAGFIRRTSNQDALSCALRLREPGPLLNFFIEVAAVLGLEESNARRPAIPAGGSARACAAGCSNSPAYC